MTNGKDHESLNQQARRAVLGFSANPEKDLAELFLSDAPIDNRTRRYIAQALTAETTMGSSLRLKGIIPTAKAYDARRKWFEAGSWIEQQGGGTDAVLERAEHLFCMGRKSCEKSLTYARTVMKWVRSVSVPNTYYANWSEEDLIELYIGFDAQGQQPPPNKTVEQIANENLKDMAFLSKLFGD